MDADGSDPIQLTNNPGAVDYRAGWSPDGMKLTFTSDQEGIYDIYVMDADGSDVVNLTQNQAGKDMSAAWQPIPLAVFAEEKSMMLWGEIKQNKAQ